MVVPCRKQAKDFKAPKMEMKREETQSRTAKIPCWGKLRVKSPALILKPLFKFLSIDWGSLFCTNCSPQATVFSSPSFNLAAKDLGAICPLPEELS